MSSFAFTISSTFEVTFDVTFNITFDVTFSITINEMSSFSSERIIVKYVLQSGRTNFTNIIFFLYHSFEQLIVNFSFNCYCYHYYYLFPSLPQLLPVVIESTDLTPIAIFNTRVFLCFNLLHLMCTIRVNFSFFNVVTFHPVLGAMQFILGSRSVVEFHPILGAGLAAIMNVFFCISPSNTFKLL